MLVVHQLRQVCIQRATANLAVQERCETRDTPHTVKRKRLASDEGNEEAERGGAEAHYSISE